MANSKELAERIDGVGRVLMALIADFERRELLDGERFCSGLRQAAETRRTVAGLETSAQVIEQIVGELDAVRSARQSEARRA